MLQQAHALRLRRFLSPYAVCLFTFAEDGVVAVCNAADFSKVFNKSSYSFVSNKSCLFEKIILKK